MKNILFFLFITMISVTFCETNDNTNVYSTNVIGQITHNQTNSFITGSTAIPWDDTIPQQTEGVEVLTVNIIPHNESTKLLIEATINAIEESNTSDHIIVALFKNDEANAIATAVEEIIGDLSGYGGGIKTITLRHLMTSGTSDEITFKIRAGLTSGTINVNGGAGSRKLGGSLYSTLSVTEIME